MKYLIYSLFVIALLFQGCGEGSFSQVTTIELPEHTSKLSVTAKVTKGTDQFPIFVSHSKAILDNTDYDIIDKASVSLFNDDQLITDYAFDEGTGSYFPEQNINISESGSYRLEVAASGYDPIKATQEMPVNATITQAEFKEDAFTDSYGDKYDIVEIEIQDDDLEENYYTVKVFATGKDINGDPITVDLYGYSEDPLLEYGYREDFLTDVTFNGGKYRYRYQLYEYWQQNFGFGHGGEIEQLEIRVYSHSKDYFRFSTSRLTYEDSQDFPFVEPVLIYSNFDDGFGIFSLKNVQTFVLDF